MELKSNKTIEKIIKKRKSPIFLKGYIFKKDKESEYIHLYPNLDYKSYYRLSNSCIIDILKSDKPEKGYVTVLVDEDCEIECVEIKKAKFLNPYKNNNCCCGHKDNDDETTAEMSRSEFRQYLITIARMLNAMGIDKMDCARIASGGTVSVACCNAWKDLAGSLGTNQEIANVQKVEAMCFTLG